MGVPFRSVSSAARLILASLVAVALGLSQPASAGQPAALVALIENPGSDAGERHFIDHLQATMVRNATHGRYSASAFLVGDLAQRFSFLRAISQFARAGYDVDVLVLVPEAADSVGDRGGHGISLSRGPLRDRDLIGALKPLRALEHGGLRVVYALAGRQMADAWREAGARSVLTGGTAPFFLPKFLRYWGEGDSLTHAAAKAASFSRDLASALSRFVPDETLLANAGLIAAAPDLSGADLDVTGREQQNPWELQPVRWPNRLPQHPRFEHNALQDGMLRTLARGLVNEIELKPELISGLNRLVDDTGNATWSTVQGVFPGRDENEIIIPGQDVRIILDKIIPDLDKYLQKLIDQVDTIVVTRNKGKMVVDAWLIPKSVRFELRKEREARRGQAYAMKLDQHTHFEISMRKDSITIDRVGGFTALIKLPVVPDGVIPRRLYLDTSTETLTISADAVAGLVQVVGTADVRARHFKGIDWLATIFKNVPLIFGLLLFSPI